MVLTDDELLQVDAYWRAANYLCVGMIYLRDNPLLRQPLLAEHVKHRLLGHFGSDPGQTLVLTHLNRLITKLDLDIMYIAGPGHGAPATLANTYLDGTYTDVYPDKTQDAPGMLSFFRQFSFPGGIGSHCTPETPGSIHEGGELGYSIAHAFGAAFDNPELIVATMVGDGEAETGPLATSWHSNKFLNPIRDGAVLPILHLNGYKIANPTILARISPEELDSLMRGYGWMPYVVEGDAAANVHQQMADVLETCITEIRRIQTEARTSGIAARPRWPMIILRTPKGWTAPKEVDGHRIEGSWRAHQVPVTDVVSNPEHLAIVERWMRSYRPEELFDASGAPNAAIASLSPRGARRIGANKNANGGALRRPLRLPSFRDYAIAIREPGSSQASPTVTLAAFLRDVMRANMTNFRVFGPDETASNRLEAIYEATKKTWLAEVLPEDADGGELAVDGRVMEMLSETTLEGWLEGYLLSGRHGLFATYEAFVHIIDSMYNQHAKWLEKSVTDVSWRVPISSLNLLITSLVWRQDHNGFSHEDPGFLDIVANKSPEITRIYLPPDGNCLLSVGDHCLRSVDAVNVIVADKQSHLVYLDIAAAVDHCTKGIGIWDWASNDDGSAPDVIAASAGDIPTMEALAAVAILRDAFPKLKVRFVNVVDLFRLQRPEEHPHGLNDRDFDSLFTTDKPVIFNFHAYPSLIHKLTYKRSGHANFHVHGYKERGNINTPLSLAIKNQIDRYNLVIDVIDRVPSMQARGAHLKDRMKNAIIDQLAYADANGTDRAEITNWTWPQVS